MRVGGSGVTLIGLDDRAGWEAATLAHGLPSQTWSYAWGLAADGAAPQLAVVRAGGAEMLLPFLERRVLGRTDIATLPGLSGALLRPDDDAPLAVWTGFARARGWVSGYIQLAVANETPAVSRWTECTTTTRTSSSTRRAGTSPRRSEPTCGGR